MKRGWSVEKLQPLAQALLPGAIAAGLSLGMVQLGIWQPLENLAQTSLFRLRQTVKPQQWDQRLVVIAIDEASLKQYGRFPWSRSRYTQLLRSLEPSPPAVVGFDILFAEPTLEDKSLATAMVDNGSVVLALAADAQGQQIDLVPNLAQATRQGHIYNRPDADGISR
jgi:CHASE2 domain-containing sensor protein